MAKCQTKQQAAEVTLAEYQGHHANGLCPCCGIIGHVIKSEQPMGNPNIPSSETWFEYRCKKCHRSWIEVRQVTKLLVLLPMILRDSPTRPVALPAQ